MSEEAIVEVGGGRLRGRREADTWEFLGIPYATAPRFAPPGEVAAWAGLRDATIAGVAAPQPRRPVAHFTLGLPALRLRGVNLAVVTLGAAFTADALLFNSQGFAGGLTGLPIKAPRLLGLNLSISEGHSYPRVIFGVMVLIIVILMGLLVARLRRGAAGRMLLAVRSNERAAASIGIDVAQAKLMAFAIAAFIAGIGGALTGYQQGTLTSDGFSTFISLGLLAVIYVAGIGRISGAVFAGIMMASIGFFVTFLDEQFGVGKYQTIVAGLALVLTAIANPDGVMSTSTGKGPAVAYFRARDAVLARVHRAQQTELARGQPAESAAASPRADDSVRPA